LCPRWLRALVTTAEDAADGSASEHQPLREAVGALLVGAGGFVGIQIAGLAVLLVAMGALGSLSDLEANVVGAVGTGVGAVAFAAVYFDVSRHDASFLDLDLPDRWDLAYVVGGLIALTALLVAISVAADALGLGLSEHSLTEQAQEGDPIVVLLLIPASILFVGPGEELIFRNLVQKRLGETFSTWGSIGLASVVFAAIHFPAYATGALPTILGSVVVVFSLSILLGWLYARTEKLVVPALTHGLYNGFQFTLLYFEVAGG
jgi:membrane protease YdiL (CAAX protease family)